ncbi:MAG: hypothetical protein U0575_15405 [Phycisphaerales bacterium]
MGLLANTLGIREVRREQRLTERNSPRWSAVFGKDHFVYLAAAKAYGDSLLAQGRPADAEPHIGGRWKPAARVNEAQPSRHGGARSRWARS